MTVRTPSVIAPLLVGATLALVAPAYAQAASVLDQSTAPATGRGVSYGGSTFAQTFTAGRTGRLTQLDLWAYALYSPSVSVAIQTVSDGVPSGDVVATGAFSGTNLGGGVQLDRQPWVVAGRQYAIVLSTGGHTSFQVDTTAGDTYAGGAPLMKIDDQPWQASSFPDDAIFQTYVDPGTDDAAPVTTVAASPAANAADWHDGPVTLDVQASDAVSGVAETHSWIDPATAPTAYDSPGAQDSPASVTTDGEHHVWVASIDEAGNAETPHEFDVDIDTAAPTTTATGISPGTSTTPEPVTLTASDDGSGVAATYYTVGTDPATPTTTSATYDPAKKPVLDDRERIKFFSVDRAGNAEAVQTSAAADVVSSSPDPDPQPTPQPDTTTQNTTPTPTPLTAKSLTLMLGSKSRQLLLDKNAIAVILGSDGTVCNVKLTGSLRVHDHRTLTLPALTTSLPAGTQTRTVHIRTTARQRAQIRKLVGRRGTNAKVTFTIQATSANGTSITKTTTIKLRREA